MPCTVGITSGEMATHFETLLCQSCKFLTKAQIDSLSNPGSGICDGLYWYSQHLMSDYHKICHKKDALSFINDNNECEKMIILNELSRIGYDLIQSSSCLELIQKE